MNSEELRLKNHEPEPAHWRRWGPYLSERMWGTVREDYSPDGSAWDYFPHDHARSRAYRWGEDGLLGISDDHQHVCFALALWNEKDPILKERLFGLTGSQGNHGEDVKEMYYYLDNTPTHSYMKALYKYPQSEYPYGRLIEENAARGKDAPEFELLDAGVFDENRYFDVQIEYAKEDPEDILIRVWVSNHGPETATIHVLPTIWFRNTWVWNDVDVHPHMYLSDRPGNPVIELDEVRFGRRRLYCDGSPEVYFTENETNTQRLFGAENRVTYVKDAFHERVIHGRVNAVNPEQRGTKAAAHYILKIEPGATEEIRLRLTNKDFSSVPKRNPFGPEFGQHFRQSIQEADAFYANIIPSDLTEDGKNVMRQAFAGMLWSKQYYHYKVGQWMDGDMALPKPPESRQNGRNHEWRHVYCADIISMPDKWEYPWFAAWDLAFHCIPLALVDSEFAKEQLILLLREWYMHPNGQLPAYEWAFADVNPPVHAWSALRVFRIEKKRKGVGDYEFLERIFHKLLLNFTWWVNRKDTEGRHLFQGGFLGLDNIGIFDRSAPLPGGGHLDQADGTAWMGFFCLNMMAMALELAVEKPAYEDVASKFLEHFTYIGQAMTAIGGDMTMWDQKDGFFYDVLCLPDGSHIDLKVRSVVGIIPLFAVETLEPEDLAKLPGFRGRLEWFIQHMPDITENVASMEAPGRGERRLLSITDEERLRCVLSWMLDENEFLSPYGIRSVSKVHEKHPYHLMLEGMDYGVNYQPAESTTSLFGGNSNWRGPVWFPINYLIIESLQKFDYYFGHNFKVECPTGSGTMMNLSEVAAELSKRLSRLFLRDEDGRRACHGEEERYRTDPHWRDLVLFHEYFHGDTGRGLGASHQTGWTGLVAKLLQQSGE
jgi:Glycosyl hydrolase family 63 C-terminal domain